MSFRVLSILLPYCLREIWQEGLWILATWACGPPCPTFIPAGILAFSDLQESFQVWITFEFKPFWEQWSKMFSFVFLVCFHNLRLCSPNGMSSPARVANHARSVYPGTHPHWHINSLGPCIPIPIPIDTYLELLFVVWCYGGEEFFMNLKEGSYCVFQKVFSLKIEIKIFQQQIFS